MATNEAPADPSPEDPAGPTSRAGCAAVLAAVFAAMAWWSRGAWPDATVDFGRELYLTWRVAEGDLLYRDLPYFDGPLSLLLNGGLASLAGMSLRTLVAANLLVAAALTVALFALLERIADRWAALAGCVLWLTTFAFARLLDVGNYNFAAPYTHLATHGTMLAAASLLCLDRVLRGSWRWGGALGLALGTAFLGKADFFAATLGAVLAGALAGVWAMPDSRAALRRAALAAAACAPLAPLLCVAWFARELPLSEAVRAALGSWPHLLGGASGLPFYRGVLGVDQLGANLRLMAVASAGWCALLAALLAAARLVRVPAGREGLAAAAAFIAPVALLSQARWPDAFRPLPLAVAALCVWSLWPLRASRGGAEAPRAALRLAFLAWGALLLGKVALNAKLRHYGFALALPGSLALCAFLVRWLPELLRRWPLPTAAARAAGLGVTASVVLAHLLVSGFWYGTLKTPVGEGADRFRAQASAAAIDEAVAWLERERPGATLAAYPDGAMLNYLARRRNPSGQTLAVPTALALIGEENVVRALAAAPPDLVAVVHKDTSDEGARFFGADYALLLDGWIRENYRGVALFGEPPHTGPGFGIVILERR
ncbi:MAG: hypothetical protein SF028_09225 [Candidatus Sumerlaeia bacterium]|nr:hypothetical protein [Candidatus Sumerlaeia bacterium]